MLKTLSLTEDQKKILATLVQSSRFTYADLSCFFDVPISKIKNYCRYHKLNKYIKKETSSGERILLEYLRDIYKSNRFKTQYHVGEGLRLDIFDPKLNIGWEYHGVQHSQLTEFFHTDEEYEKALARDQRKHELCKYRGINLVVVYPPSLTIENVREIISSVEPGTGEVSEKAVRTYREFSKRIRQECRGANKHSEYKQRAAERACDCRKQQYLRSKQWKRNFQSRKRSEQARTSSYQEVSDEKVKPD